VDGMTSFLDMTWCTAMMVFRPVQWAGTILVDAQVLPPAAEGPCGD
jgi:hypothetical protein